MSRPRRHPSGPAQTLTIRLSPAALDTLDQWRRSRGLSRAAAVERAILQGMARTAHAPPVVPSPTTAPLIRQEVEATKSRHPTTRVEEPDAARAARVAALTAEVTGTEVVDVCNHSRAGVISGGMRRCPDCGAVKGLGGYWRVT